MNEGGLISVIMHSPKKRLVILLAAVGAALLLLGTLAGGKKDAAPEGEGGGNEELAEYAATLEGRIKSLCEKVDGVSDVSVLLTLDSGVERVYAENGAGAGKSYVVISSGGEERVVLVREICSSVRGIAVVCRGGEKISVQKTVSELLSCALGVPISKISVAGTGK